MCKLQVFGSTASKNNSKNIKPKNYKKPILLV